ncbi:helix-turn-helix domain-containing protein [Oscillibacter sp.]|uniref:helix-turn-helix domain-containing protein n=1 Tax=Oscillibacter sp. TaxID=1945593 RepID=UPI001B05ADF0|nr:helix-turn-helix transcriptional regulator [Oscillibacter sp.]MBO5049744.1 helix-turn-helix transcriptional regulator [Oscillospiraceae bacterium]MBP3509575.1 helix-turn-helix transcriptional regulator [Oscillibacter sp.]
MQISLTIPERLKDLRVERHLTLEQLAEATGISKSALGKYETGENKDISPYSIVELAKFYEVSTDYLLARAETKNHPNTDLHDLHLSDDMIALLKSGKINNRLLCEMATHKDFQRLMVDMEIFVDRIADMRIKDTNAVLDATRRQVMEKYNPGENDLYVRTLELAQINEDDYFSHVVHNDMDGIMRDIRDAHQKDALTADAETPAAEVQKQLETAMSYEGSEEEKKARVFLASLGIDYDTLTPEEFVTQINILKKSKHLKSPYSQRGKASPYQKHGKGKKKR